MIRSMTGRTFCIELRTLLLVHQYSIAFVLSMFFRYLCTIICIFVGYFMYCVILAHLRQSCCHMRQIFMRPFRTADSPADSPDVAKMFLLPWECASARSPAKYGVAGWSAKSHNYAARCGHSRTLGIPSHP